MPHKGKKRQRSVSDDGDKQKPSKQTKANDDPESTQETDKAPNGQPTNKVLPVTITFPPLSEGNLRLATWNICGLAASQKKGFRYYVEAEDPDILVLTETKVNDIPVDPSLKARFPFQTWSISAKKTYSGTAVLSKHEPLSVNTTLPGHPDPDHVKGRIITLEFVGCYVVATYVVNAGQGLKTLDAKNQWNHHFEAYLRDLDKRKPVIWMGDMNVAPTENDLANAKRNWNKTPGYTKDETEAFERILNPSTSDTENFVDIWRDLHPTDRHYTYFSYRFNCRTKGIGWRLDMFVLSQRLTEQVKMCEIRSEIYGASDHVPLVMEVNRTAILGS